MDATTQSGRHGRAFLGQNLFNGALEGHPVDRNVLESGEKPHDRGIPRAADARPFVCNHTDSAVVDQAWNAVVLLRRTGAAQPGIHADGVG